MKRTVFLLIYLSVVVAALADVVKGRVIDAQTKEPLPGASINVEITGELYGDDQLTADSLGCFVSPDWWTCVGNIKASMKISYFGYHQAQKMTSLFEGNDTIDLGDIALKPSAELLKELEVKGRMRRFTMDGDTVVFHPEAFHLEEGARLEELIHKLPGVSVTEMGLMWNGKPLMIKMNGHDALADGDMMGRLPAEIVQCIKTYEKRSELSERTGLDDGQGEQVLDIVIKPGFMDRFYGDVSAKGTTAKHYAAEGDMQRLSDFDPIALYARAGDDDECKLDKGWGRGGLAINDEYRQQMGMLGYQHAWDSKYKEVSERNRWNIDLTPNHYDKMTSSWSRRENFMPDGQSTHTRQSTSNYAHTFKVPIGSNWRRALSKDDIMTGGLSLYFGRNRDEGRSQQQTTAPQTTSSGVVSPSGDGGAVNESTSQQLSEKENLRLDFHEAMEHFFKGGNVNIELRAQAEKEQQDHSSTADYTYVSLPSRHDVQTGHSDRHWLEGGLKVGGSKWFGRNVMTLLSYDTSYRNDYQRNNRMRGDGTSMAEDLSNSLRQRQQQLRHDLFFMLEEKLDRVSLEQTGTIDVITEWLDYRRGQVLDTVARRTILEPDAHFKMRWRTTKASSLNADFAYNRRAPGFISTMAYTDDTNPLYITQGNPNLRPTTNLGVSLKYDCTLLRSEQNLSAGASFNRTIDPVLSLLRYNSLTGAYRSSQMNGRGGYQMDVNANYDRTLGGYLRLTLGLSVGNGISYGNQTLVDGDETVRLLRQQSVRADVHPRLSYDSERWNAELSLRAQYSGSYYNTDDYLSTRLWDYDPTFSTTCKLRHWTFKLSSHLRGGNGYLSDDLNRAKFIMDAEVTWKCLKGKGQLSLLANDIFNQDMRLSSRITPTQRSESGRSFIHHYLGLVFTYHLDARTTNKNNL